MRSRVENEASLKRMEEIREIIERIDFRWDHGFIDRDEYFEKRIQLEREIESLRPIDYDELHEAADLIRNFRSYWEQCAETAEPDEARQQPLAKIVEQVIVYDDSITHRLESSSLAPVALVLTCFVFASFTRLDSQKLRMSQKTG